MRHEEHCQGPQFNPRSLGIKNSSQGFIFCHHILICDDEPLARGLEPWANGIIALFIVSFMLRSCEQFEGGGGVSLKASKYFSIKFFLPTSGPPKAGTVDCCVQKRTPALLYHKQAFEHKKISSVKNSMDYLDSNRRL
jgi:hypothetical protein